MKEYIKIVIGLLLILLAIYAVLSWNSWLRATIALLQGGIIGLVVLVGIALVVLGISDAKEAQ